MGNQFAEFDYQLKLQAHRINDWLNIVAEVKTHMGDTGRTASE